ncbi:hypothetical protein [uncultured Dokdonia sp.]|uniref:hypothetical protein n=1 Tax=uncultured Dokdonia sp. TaxID=575653 RepID=UPI00261FCE5A|nr:hypothetical protein [uncultured Dokdonia sp.]
MKFYKVNYDKDDSLSVSFQIDEDFQFLLCEVSGHIANGSKGNNASDYLFGKVCQYYFQMNCYALILDFSDLEYSFGDRLRKTINFFKVIGRDKEEKMLPVILIKPENEEGINTLIDWIKPTHLHITTTVEKAKKVSLDLFNEYMDY